MRLGEPVRFRGRSGLTLLEVVLSIAILGGVVVGVLKIRQRAQESAQLARGNLICTRLCADQAALLRAGELGEGEGSCDHPQPHVWTVAREPLADDMPKGLSAYRVSVRPDSDDTTAAASVVVWIASSSDNREASR